MSVGNRISIASLLLALGIASFAAPAAAHDAPATTPAGYKNELLFWIKDAEGKLIQLADATPEAKYSWRPSKGVRTTGEVFMHVAAANFGLPSFAGVKPPEGFDFQNYEKSLTKKADIHKALKDSFAHMQAALSAASDADLEREIDLFGTKSTVRGAYLLLLSHCHEHLGQSIAYARSNGVVPPWTEAQEKAIKELQEKKKAAGGGQ